MEIIDDQVLHYLPFSPEPLLQWGERIDLLGFSYALYDEPGVIVLYDGTRENINYREVGYHVYQRGKKKSRAWAHSYTQSAEENTPVPGAYDHNIYIPDFYEDPIFGETAKYVVAWEEVVGAALSSSAFFSIAHVLESRDDLRCSFKLAEQLYYKHASQVLRSFLEDLVLPIHFAQDPQRYSQWRDSDYQTPRLRGQNGILRSLTDQQVVSEALADRISALYGDLNGFVHGSEKRLVNKGQYTNSWLGHVFNFDDYSQWCKHVKESVSLGVDLLRTSLTQWEKLRLQHTVMCTVCHNNSEFHAEQFVFGGEEFTQYRCYDCGNEMTHNYEGRQAYGQSFGGKMVSYQYSG